MSASENKKQLNQTYNQAALDIPESPKFAPKIDISLPEISEITKTPPKVSRPKNTIEAVKIYADQPMLFQRQKRREFIRKRIQFTQQFCEKPLALVKSHKSKSWLQGAKTVGVSEI